MKVPKFGASECWVRQNKQNKTERQRGLKGYLGDSKRREDEILKNVTYTARELIFFRIRISGNTILFIKNT